MGTPGGGSGGDFGGGFTPDFGGGMGTDGLGGDLGGLGGDMGFGMGGDPATGFGAGPGSAATGPGTAPQTIAQADAGATRADQSVPQQTLAPGGQQSGQSGVPYADLQRQLSEALGIQVPTMQAAPGAQLPANLQGVSQGTAPGFGSVAPQGGQPSAGAGWIGSQPIVQGGQDWPAAATESAAAAPAETPTATTEPAATPGAAPTATGAPETATPSTATQPGTQTAASPPGSSPSSPFVPGEKSTLEKTGQQKNPELKKAADVLKGIGKTLAPGGKPGAASATASAGGQPAAQHGEPAPHSPGTVPPGAAAANVTPSAATAPFGGGGTASPLFELLQALLGNTLGPMIGSLMHQQGVPQDQNFAGQPRPQGYPPAAPPQPQPAAAVSQDGTATGQEAAGAEGESLPAAAQPQAQTRALGFAPKQTAQAASPTATTPTAATQPQRPVMTITPPAQSQAGQGGPAPAATSQPVPASFTPNEILAPGVHQPPMRPRQQTVDPSAFQTEIAANRPSLPDGSAGSLIEQAAWMVQGESTPKTSIMEKRVLLELARNRAHMRGTSLAEALLPSLQKGDPGYYDGLKGLHQGTYRWSAKPDAATLAGFYRDVWVPVMQHGTNHSDVGWGPMTGNASGGVAVRQFARGTPGYRSRATGESYFLEGPVRRLPEANMWPSMQAMGQ